MNRRAFLIQSAAFLASASAPRALLAQRPHFRPTRFSTAVRGSGPDVILIPGLASSRQVWDQAVAAVPGYRYHLIQVAGFAGAPARGNADGPIVVPLAAEIARYIEAEGLRRPAIVGHSMGGTLAMMLAARYPARVGRVMVVDMLPRPTALYGGTSAGQLATALNNIIDTPLGRNLLSSVIGAFTPPVDQGRASDPDVVARSLHDLGVIDLTAELPRIRVPLTVLYADRGEDGQAITERAFTQAYRTARGARLVPIPQSGHLIMSDQPRRFARELAAFLR